MKALAPTCMVQKRQQAPGSPALGSPALGSPTPAPGADTLTGPLLALGEGGGAPQGLTHPV